MKNILALFLVVSTSALAQPRGYGDRYDSLPTFNERQLHVLTNACRMAPTQYRDAYIGSSYQILLPANYPAVRPLYWNLALNRSSHAHAIDMANNCGLQHNSCNGTVWSTRIGSYYTKTSFIGENIACGYTTAIATLKQWVLDSQMTTGTIPADKDPGGADGHRANIMNNGYRELGCGYTYGPKQWYYFWVHDFGGGKPDFTNTIVGGCHFFLTSGIITFFANYWDSLGAPDSISVVIENHSYPMTLAMGIATRGTYSFAQAKSTACRKYYFTARRGATQWRYPEYGVLVSSGEGTCTKDYTPPESLTAVIAVSETPPRPTIRCLLKQQRLTIDVSGLQENATLNSIALTDLRGTVVSAWHSSGHSRASTTITVQTPKPLAAGAYCCRVAFTTGQTIAEKILITPLRRY